MHDLISTKKNKKNPPPTIKQIAGREWIVKHSPKVLASKEKLKKPPLMHFVFKQAGVLPLEKEEHRIRRRTEKKDLKVYYMNKPLNIPFSRTMHSTRALAAFGPFPLFWEFSSFTMPIWSSTRTGCRHHGKLAKERESTAEWPWPAGQAQEATNSTNQHIPTATV